MIETVDLLPGCVHWWSLPVGNGDMERHNAEGFYELGKTVSFLFSCNAMTDKLSAAGSLYQAHALLSSFVTSGSVQFSEGCRQAARSLTEIIETLIQGWPENIVQMAEQKATLGNYGAFLRPQTATFQTLFIGDSVSLNLFYIPPVLAYSSTVLIEGGEKLIPDALHGVMPDLVKQDVQSGARCVAFELPTASAFHMARAMEGTMRQYHIAFVGPLPTTYQQLTFGSLINAFNAVGSPALVANLRHIKDNYRNPISHPDQTITVPESHVFLGVYVAAITAMLYEIHTKPHLT